MFITDQVRIPLPFAVAAVRLANLTRCTGLTGASHQAWQECQDALIRVGPLGDRPGMAKLVRVQFLDPAWSERGMSVGLRWEATGSTAGLFPVLDADLVLAPASRRACTLALSGAYRPPLGRLGATLDRSVFGAVATATIRSLLQCAASEMTNPFRPAGQAGRGEPAP
ncbi:MAG TPA: hypothetical protein VNF47_15560 [Streptosporangiaceae bacterium]|nr:hypothetical protein [Streptosporangiaceae bacterium]